MSFSNHISVTWDVATFLDWVPVTPSTHHHLFIPPPPAPPAPVPMPFGPSIEMLALIAHPPGALCGEHKLSSTVYHHGTWIALDGHNCGRVIFHLCLCPGFCVYMARDILTSSRKAKFAAGAVKADGAPIACCTFFDIDYVPTPMMACGAIPVPLQGTGMSFALNSVIVGMHGVDLLAGWVDIAVSMIQGFLTAPAELLVDPLGIGDLLGLDPLPDFGAIGGGLVRLAGQHLSDYSGDWELGYEPVSGPFGSGGVKLSGAGDTGDVALEGAGGVRAGSLVGAQGAGRYVWSEGGGGGAEAEGGFDWAGGGQHRWNTRGTESHRDANMPWSNDVEVPFI